MHIKGVCGVELSQQSSDACLRKCPLSALFMVVSLSHSFQLHQHLGCSQHDAVGGKVLRNSLHGCRKCAEA